MDKVNKNLGFAVLKAIIVLAVVAGFMFFVFHKSSFSFVNDNILADVDSGLLPDSSFVPEEDPNRVNFLIMGIRGIDDEENGGLLADTVMLASIEKDTGDLALISIPRDLYVYINRSKREKLNAVYAYGESFKWGGGGLDLSKKVVSQITGQKIDYAMSVNFEAFEEFIDILGGVPITLKKPFLEYKQWANYPPHLKEENEQYWRLNEEEQRWEMYLDEGDYLLDGEMALYYSRARFSSNDFERVKRQQEVILAVKDRLFSLGVLMNPIKVFEILDMLNKNVRRDFGVLDVKSLLGLAKTVQGGETIRKSLDISSEGLLYDSTDGNLYILAPVGDNYDQIRDMVKNIFN